LTCDTSLRASPQQVELNEIVRDDASKDILLTAPLCFAVWTAIRLLAATLHAFISDFKSVFRTATATLEPGGSALGARLRGQNSRCRYQVSTTTSGYL
jgi:hypothetical protein